jgi:ABC-2 type transport system permease protein
MMAPLIYMFVWVIAAGDGTISGFSRSDFMTYYALLIIINQLTYPISHWTIGDAIFEGTFSTWLLRPLHPVYEAISTDIAGKIVTIPFVMVFVLIIVLILRIDFDITISNIGIGIISLVMALILRFILGYTLALLALYTQKLTSVLTVNNTLTLLLAGQIMPTALLPDLVRDIAMYLPYRYVIGFPIELILGKLGQTEITGGIVIQATWIAVILVLQWIVWRNGLKRFSAVGG